MTHKCGGPLAWRKYLPKANQGIKIEENFVRNKEMCVKQLSNISSPIYGNECWAISSEGKKEVVLRRILRITYTIYVINEGHNEIRKFGAFDI